MKRNIVIMDFSGIYQEEQFYEGEQISWIDLSDISGTNCYCDGDAQAQILERMEKYPVSGIYFIDSGNYHYMSRIGIGRVKEPFNLLVFDNHTDMQLPAFGGLLSCGGWIASALEEVEKLQEVWLIGPDEEAYGQVEEPFKDRVHFLSRERLAEARPYMAEKKGSEEELIRSLEIPANIPLYISIDKDVLCPEDADTNWSQGDMRLETMVRCLECAVSRCKAGDILSTGSENADIGQLDAVREDTQKDGAACSDLTVADLCLFPGILGVDICGECDAAGTGNSALNDYANARLWEFFRHAAENETSGGDR